MSKKMIKRSLALGALMAFVITGSAYAETHYIIKLDGSVVQVDTSSPSSNVEKGSCDYSGLVINGWDDFKGKDILEKMYYPGSEKLEEDTEIEGKIEFKGNNADSSNPTFANTDLNGHKLTVINNGSGYAISASGRYNAFDNDRIYVECEKDSYKGYIKRENLPYEIKDNELEIPGFSFTNGDLVVESGSYGILGYGKVDVVTLKITSGNNAITSIKGSNNWSDDLSLNINAENIELYVGASGNAIQVANTLKIYSDVLNITNIEGSNYGRAIRVTQSFDDGKSLGTPVANIYADTLNISGATKTSKVDSNGTLNLSAKKGEIINDFEAASTGTINVTFGSGVNWTGAFATADDATGNVTLNGATWKVTGNSNITTLKGNDGKIELAAVPATYSLRSTNNGFVTLQIGDASDSSAVVTGEGLTEAVENGELTAEEALKKLSGSVIVEEGTATLALEEGETTGATSATVGSNGMSSVKQEVNTKAAKVSKAATNLKAHYRAHMNDMNKRMGELRMANGEAGVWTRMVRGESEYEGAKMQYNQYQLGYDEKLSVDKRWTVGAAVTFAEGDGSYGQGSTEDKSTAFAIYGSKLNNDGTFVDLIARYAHLESDMEDSVYGNGDYSTNGMSVSAEFGKRIQQGNGLWVEPQVELTYGTVDSADFRLDKGYNAHFDSMDSFIARVGFSIGKDIKQGNVYARASYLYDFDGETTSLVTNEKGVGTPTPEDFGGGWWEVGVGANINLSKATYIYADIEKTFGGEVDTNWKWNLGVRYSF